MTTLHEPEDVQMPTDPESQVVKKRGHSTETEDTPRKKAKDQGHEVDGVPGKKVQYYHIQVLIGDHRSRYIGQTKQQTPAALAIAKAPRKK